MLIDRLDVIQTVRYNVRLSPRESRSCQFDKGLVVSLIDISLRSEATWKQCRCTESSLG